MIRIATHPDGSVRQVETESGLARRSGKFGASPPQDLFNADRRQVGERPIVFRPRQAEQSLDQEVSPIRSLYNEPEGFLILGNTPPPEQRPISVDFDCRQGRAKLVRRIGREAALLLYGLLQPREGDLQTAEHTIERC